MSEIERQFIINQLNMWANAEYGSRGYLEAMSRSRGAKKEFILLESILVEAIELGRKYKDES